jgi:hypothetical protein
MRNIMRQLRGSPGVQSVRTTLLLVGVGALIGCTGCEALFHRGSLGYGHDSYAEEMRAESLTVLASNDTTYQRRMWDFRRRAAAIDTDSLRLLYIALATVPDSERLAIRHRFQCFGTAGLMTYGRAFFRADLRLVESLRQHGGDLLMRGDLRLQRNDPHDPGLNNRTCGGFPQEVIHDTLEYVPMPTAMEAARRKNKAESDSMRALPRKLP